MLTHTVWKPRCKYQPRIFSLIYLVVLSLCNFYWKFEIVQNMQRTTDWCGLPQNRAWPTNFSRHGWFLILRPWIHLHLLIQLEDFNPGLLNMSFKGGGPWCGSVYTCPMWPQASLEPQKSFVLACQWWHYKLVLDLRTLTSRNYYSL